MQAKLSLLALVAGLSLMAPSMAAAQAPQGEGVSAPRWFDDRGAAAIGGGIGAGLVLIGGAAGIGRIGGSAAESMSRQPEAAGSINTIALITAAMIEGATLFAVVVCLLAVGKVGG